MPCEACGLRVGAQSHCDRWDCQQLAGHQGINRASRLIAAELWRPDGGFERVWISCGERLLSAIHKAIETAGDREPIADLRRSPIVYPGFGCRIIGPVVEHEGFGAGRPDDDLSDSNHSDIYNVE